MLARYLKPDLLIIDDMGMKQLPKRSGEYLFEIIMRRYETRSTMMTSNRPLEDWGKLLGDVPTRDGDPGPVPAPRRDRADHRPELPPAGPAGRVGGRRRRIQNQPKRPPARREAVGFKTSQSAHRLRRAPREETDLSRPEGQRQRPGEGPNHGSAEASLGRKKKAGRRLRL